MDFTAALASITRLMEKIGEPLTEPQKDFLAGSLAVWINEAYKQRL